MEEFLDGLPAKTARKVVWVLGLVEELEVVPALYFKKLEGAGEIYECRIVHAGNAYRVLCFWSGADEVVMTHGCAKKTQKTPRTEIEKAKAYRLEYFKRRSLQ